MNIQLLDAIILLVSLLANLLQWLYQRYEKVFMCLQRLKFYFSNRTTLWNLTFEFNLQNEGVEESRQAVEDAFHKIKSQDNFNVYTDLPNSKVVQVAGVIYKLFAEPGKSSVHVVDQRVPYRDSIRIIEKQLLPLVESVERAVRVISERYALIVKFDASRNPYLGVFLQRVKGKQIRSFQCLIVKGDRGQDSVTIGLDTLSIVATSRESFRSLSRSYLALSSET